MELRRSIRGSCGLASQMTEWPQVRASGALNDEGVLVPGATQSNSAAYQPPAFDLFEARVSDASEDITRWLHGWNGLVGALPGDVTLGLSTPDARALVTSSEWASEWDARIAAGMIAAQLDGLPQGVDAAGIIRAALDSAVWQPSSLAVDGHAVPVLRATLFGRAVAHTSEVGTGFAVAWRGGDVTIRRVLPGGTGEYTADPLIAHSYEDLEKQTP